MSSTSASDSLRKQRHRSQRFGRTRTGCLTCRVRKKKCDERKPICRACERNGLLCSSLASSTNSMVDAEPRGSSPASTAPLVRPNSDSQGYRSTASRQPRLMQRGAFVEDLAQPTLEDASLAYVLKQSPCGHRALKSPASGTLIEHFFYRSADLLSSVRGRNNPLINLILPVAMSSDLVLQCILALSGVHYRNFVSTNALDIQIWSHMAQALRGLKHALTKRVLENERNTLECLCAIVILCILETVRGDVEGTVYRHISAARALLSSASNELPNDYFGSNIRGFILEYYTYSESLSRITLNMDCPSLEPDLVDPVLLEDNLASYQGYGALCGCAYPLFLLVRRVADLVRRASFEREQLAGLTPTTRCALQKLHTQIDAWTPEQNALPEFAACGRIYQQATRICVLISLADHASTIASAGKQHTCQGFESAEFDVFICRLNDLPADSPISQTLCWPLAVVGCCTTESEHRKVIKQRLVEMYRIFGIGNYLPTARWLEEVWQSQPPATGQTSNIDKLFRSRKLNNSFA